MRITCARLRPALGGNASRNGNEKSAGAEAPASVQSVNCANTVGRNRVDPGSPGRLRQHGSKSMRTRKVRMHLVLVVNNG